MADFFSSGWSIFIAVATIVSIIACYVLALAMSRGKVLADEDGNIQSTGHVWDENLTELNNPLPKWWLYLFYITCIFSVIYLVLYPGLGAYQGLLGWSQTGQYETEVAKVKERVAPLYAKYTGQKISDVAEIPEAVEMGQRLYLTYCIQCHGSDARGSVGFPSLVDNDWLGGGTPAYIKQTILNGRNAVMPPMAAALGPDVDNVAHYVASLSDLAHDDIKAARGKEKFGTCAACHGADGKGNAAIGAPNLTDDIWLHGVGVAAIANVVNNGVQNAMPAFSNLVDDGPAHVLAAYVWSLSKEARAQAPAAK
ncbi:MAG: cytochrome-c oxidase, cbb3-type subunit III [Burkholderiaceae bacterium]